MKYSIKDLREQFPTDDACLEYIFQSKEYICPQCNDGVFYRVKKRKAYACKCGYQVNPLNGTIFFKSSTPLTLWFHAIFLASQSKNGIAAAELQRQLGVTYKCAWRMNMQIRKLMGQDEAKLSGTVEVDETLIGGRKSSQRMYENKTIVLGAVERFGKVRLKASQDRYTHTLLSYVEDSVQEDSVVYSDQYSAYMKIEKYLGIKHDSVNHSIHEYVRGEVHTNTIEGFWSQLKRSLHGTYAGVSPQHLQSYLDEFAFRYNHRDSPVPVFHHLLAKMVE